MIAPFTRPRHVVVAPAALDLGYDVTVEPPLRGAGNFDEYRQSILSARAYAEMLGSRLGLPVRDLTTEATA